MKKNNGFTLIEIIITLALMGIVLASAFGIMQFGYKLQSKTISEYDVQVSTRLVSDNVNKISRYSTAVFTIPKNSFTESKLTDGWNYIGIMNNEIVTYTFSLIGGVPTHTKEVLIPVDPNIDYKIVFNESTEDHDNKILKFSIQGFVKGVVASLDAEGNPIPYISISSQVESLNSLQVIHKGTDLDPAVALAFRGDDRTAPEIQQILPVAQVAMVLDRSGSMNWKMDGSNTWTESERRISILKEAATELINSFQASDNPVSISLVPFSTTANYTKSFKSAQTEATSLKADINALVADGGTNTGDGIRRAYQNILAGRSNPDYATKVVSDYIIILVDGVTTFGTRTSSSNSNSAFMTADGNVPSDQYVYGLGNALDNTHGTPYVNLIGNQIKADGNIKVYVIGFSSRTSDLGSVDDIVAATGAAPKFLAGDIDELKLAFGEIQQDILNDLWYISGPDL